MLVVGLRVVAGMVDDAVPMIWGRIERIELQWNLPGIDDVVIRPSRDDHPETRSDRRPDAIENCLTGTLLWNPQPGKPFVTGWITFIPRQEALVAGDQCPAGVYKLLRIHLELPHLQFRISGMSSPCFSMYCLCSSSLSRMACLT